MGRIKKKRGKTSISGLAGNIEIYNVKGETFFKAHAKKHKKSRSKEAVAGRSNFASVVKFAREIIKVPELKEVWSHSSLEGRNEFQKLIRYNMPLAFEGDLTIKNFCTPKGVKLYIPDLSLEEETLSFAFDVYGVIKPPLKIHLLYYMYNCKWKDSFDFLVTSNCINISQENSGKFRKNGESKYVIKQKLETSVTETLSYFKDVIVFVAVTGTPTIAKRKGWTNTVGFDIPQI